jgi:hypothetical protein
MTVSYLVRYEGTPSDPERFHNHYATAHAGIRLALSVLTRRDLCGRCPTSD